MTFDVFLCVVNRDGPQWARQRSCIQKLMMSPPSAAKFLDFQMPVARDFADAVGGMVDSDGIVPNLYEKLFQYTMECKFDVICHCKDSVNSFLLRPTCTHPTAAAVTALFMTKFNVF